MVNPIVQDTPQFFVKKSGVVHQDVKGSSKILNFGSSQIVGLSAIDLNPVSEPKQEEVIRAPAQEVSSSDKKK